MTIVATPAQTAAIDFLNKELAKLFPTSYVNVRLVNFLGEVSINVYYMNAAKPSDCVSGIAYNDPAYMHFTIWGRPGEFWIDKPTTHSSQRLKSFGCNRFVTMKGETELACAAKLVAFFKKYSRNILALGR